MDTLPHTALINTASLNSIVTDSAPGAACYSTGNKGNNNQEGVFPDDTADKWDNPRVELIGDFLARTQGKALGIVTTADVEDATPAAFAVHTQDRGAGTGICDMYPRRSGRQRQSPRAHGRRTQVVPPAGTAGSGRIARDCHGLRPPRRARRRLGRADRRRRSDPRPDRRLPEPPASTTPPTTPRSTPLPAHRSSCRPFPHRQHECRARQDRPSAAAVPRVANDRRPSPTSLLDEMTAEGARGAHRNRKGFVLMVEGASIDKQAHNMDTERWILDTIEFDRAIAGLHRRSPRTQSGHPRHRHRRPRMCRRQHHRWLPRDQCRPGARAAAGGAEASSATALSAPTTAGFPSYSIAATATRPRRRLPEAHRLRRQRRPLRGLAHERPASAA